MLEVVVWRYLRLRYALPRQTNPAMSNILDQAIEIYVFVDDFLKGNPSLAAWRRSNNGAQPAFTDAEVITVALMQPALQLATVNSSLPPSRRPAR